MSTTENIKATTKATKNTGKRNTNHTIVESCGVLVAIKKEKDQIDRVDAARAAIVTKNDLRGAKEAASNLALNFLADTVAPFLITAIETKGGFSDTIDGRRVAWLDDPTIKALRDIHAVPRATRVAAWEAKVKNAKKLHGISVLALAGAVRAFTRKPGEAPFKLREALAAWIAKNDTIELPMSLYDIFEKADLIPEEPKAKPEPSRITAKGRK